MGGNDFTGVVDLTNSGTNAVQLTDSNAVTLGAVSVGDSTLQVDAVGITQNAGDTITQAATAGAATFNGGAGEITLTEAGNDFTGAVELSNSGANDVQVVDAAGLNLGTSNVGGNLIATATTGNVSDSGTVTVAGYGSFTTSAAGADINLGTLAVTGEVRLSTNGVGGDATVVDSGGLVFGTSSVGGALDATAGGGDLTQTAATNISVGGTADFTAPGGNNVYLGETNSFGNTVTFSSGGTLNDVTVQDTTALELGGLGINGNLNVTSGGSITQSGALAVTGTSDFTLTSGTTDILLELGNTFGSTITFADNGNIQDLSFRKAAGAAGFPVIPGGVRDLTVVWNTGFTMPGVTVTGVMSLSGGGAVDQSGAIVAPSLVLLGAGSYDLTNAGNDVDTLAASTGGFIDFFDSDGLTVGSVAGTDGITTSDDDVTLTTGAALDITHAVAVGAGDLTLDAAGAVTHSAVLSGAGLELLGTGGYTLNSVANSFTTIAGNVTNDVLYEDGGGIAIGTVNTVGLSAANVTITTAGDITQSQAISTANGSFTAGANVITLNNGGNDFTGVVDLTNSGTNAVQLTDSNAVTLGAVSVGDSTLQVDAVGITQNAGDTITQAATAGAATFNGGAGEITLTEANDFTGAVELSNSGANDVQVVDAAGLNLGTSNVGGNLIATATTGNVSDSGTVTVAGYGSFTTSAAGADINLGTLAVTGEVRLSTNGVGGDATVVDSGGLVFGTSSVGGALDATAGGGDLTQTAATNISVGGTADFTAPGGNNVYLGETNSFGNTVTFSSGGTLNNVTVQDTTALELGGGWG